MKKICLTALIMMVSSFMFGGTIVFADLGLENGVQYIDPLDGGDFTVTFGGGQNDGKYYNTGQSIRVYGNGTMTISAKSGNLKKIVLTFADGDSYHPTSADVVDTGTYNVESFEWTGEASTVMFTRPTGSGHWRVQAVEATVEGGAVVEKKTPEISFNPTSLTVTMGEKFTEPTLSYNGDGTISYSIDNTAVASINTSTGKLNITGFGYAIVKAISSETANYKRRAASYSLNVVAGETPDEGEAIVFAELGLENAVQYTDPIDGGSFTVTFAGGSNDGKYYTTGQAIRVYGNGTMTVAAKSGNLTKVIVTFAEGDTYRPTSADIVDNGSFDPGTGVWTGSSPTVKFTRPEGTGHWRVQKVGVIIEGDTVSEKKTPEMSFSPKSLTVSKGESFTEPTLSYNGDGAISYSIDNSEVATIDVNTGKLNIKGIGTAIITATSSETANFNQGTATYTLIVKPGEKQIYGKIDFKGYCSVEYAFQLTLFYGELPDDDVYIIDKTTGIPQWKGITWDNIRDKYNSYYHLEDEVDKALSIAYFDKSMIEANIVSTSHWFENMSELKYVYGLENLNMSHVTDMSYMFAGCSSLRCLDMSGFQFTTTTNTTNMFDGCNCMQFISAPTSLAIVNNERLFYSIGSREKPCYIATPNGYNYNVDASGQYFVYKSGYFINCESEIYYSSESFADGWEFDATSHISIRYDKLQTYLKILWSYAIKELGTIDTFYNFFIDESSIWGAPKYYTFYGMGPVWENIGDFFDGYDYHNGIGGSVFIHSSFANYRPKTMHRWFANVTFGDLWDYYGSWWGDDFNGKIIYFTGLENINTSEVTDMSYMFSNSTVNPNLLNLNTSNVTNMSNMFSYSGYNSLDLSNFNTSKVTNMSQMFLSCKALKELDLSNFDMSNVTNSDDMLAGCDSLRNLWISLTMNIMNETACEGVGTETDPCVIHAPEGFDFGVDTSGDYFVWKSGYFILSDTPVPYVALSKDKKTLTFIYDNNRMEYDGITYLIKYVSSPEWLENKQSITKVIFDDTFKNAHPKSTSNWFAGMSNLKTIEGLDNLNTANVESFYQMFNGCSSLTSLDLSSFDTSNAIDMWDMFCGCSSITSLDLISFDTSNVIYMVGMFAGCSSLTSLDITNFNTTNIRDMWNMFAGCSSLTSLDLKNFNTLKVESMEGMFAGCSSLTSLDLSSFNTSNVTNMGTHDGMFSDCSSLISLDLSSFNTSKVECMNGMFSGCSSLASLDLSNFNTSNVISMADMFADCTSLTSLDLSSFNTSKVEWMSGMFQGCSSLLALDLSSFDTSKATDMNSIFKGCSSLESLDLSYFTIGENTQTAEMMSGCVALNRLFVSSTMNRLEPDACLGVGTTTSPCEIKAPSGFDYGVSTSGDYFHWKGGCFAITSEEYANISSDGTTITFYCDGRRSSRSGTTYDLQLSGKPDWSSQATTITKAVIDPSFSFARPVTVRSWFEGMKNLKVIEGIENLNTSEAEYTSYMFQNCSSIETLDLSHFDTRKVKMMGAMFKGCSSLKSVDISNFDSGICTSLNSMFYGCNKLTSLDLSALTINESADSRSMLNGCTALEELTIPESAGNLNSTAFTTVGTSDAPCILHAPEGFDFGTDTGSAFQWKGGWFVLHTPATITASVASLSPGNAAQLIVRMNNGMASSYNGFEMVVRLPEGMSLAKKGNDFNCKLGERCSGMSMSVSDLGNGTYRIMGYSLSNATISGTEGALLLLSISCPENVPVGSYTGTLEDISLSTTTGTGEEPEVVTFPIVVSQYRMGDVDLNGKINVIDVMLVVSHILGDKLNNFHAEYADIDGNGKINVLDVTTIIDVILNSPYMNQQAPERVSHTTHLTQLPASGGVMLTLDGTERFTACQMDVRIDGGAMLRGVKLLGGNASTHSVKYSRLSDDMWRVVVYSAKGTVLENGAPLLQFLTDGKGGSQKITIENVELCSEMFDSITPECVEGSATAITEAGTDIQEVPTYTIQGIRIAKPQRGVNIRKGTKVTVK